MKEKMMKTFRGFDPLFVGRLLSVFGAAVGFLIGWVLGEGEEVEDDG